MKKKKKRLSCEALKAKMDEHANFILVDVLSKDDYDHAHIKGAIHIALDDLQAKGPQWLTNQVDVIVYSANETCKGAEFAREKLSTLGFRVWTLDGGLETWEKAKYPMEGNPNYKPHTTTEKPKSLQQEKPKPKVEPKPAATAPAESEEKRVKLQGPTQGTHKPHETGPKLKPGHGLPATKKDAA